MVGLFSPCSKQHFLDQVATLHFKLRHFEYKKIRGAFWLDFQDFCPLNFPGPEALSSGPGLFGAAAKGSLNAPGLPEDPRVKFPALQLYYQCKVENELNAAKEVGMVTRHPQTLTSEKENPQVLPVSTWHDIPGTWK